VDIVSAKSSASLIWRDVFWAFSWLDGGGARSVLGNAAHTPRPMHHNHTPEICTLEGHERGEKKETGRGRRYSPAIGNTGKGVVPSEEGG